MTNEELVKNVQEGRDREISLSKLYQKNRGMLYRTAQKYGGYLAIDDLMQEGFIGMMRAAESYNPYRGASFLTYALHWIENAMHRSISKYEPVRLPEYAREDWIAYKQVCSSLESDEEPVTVTAIAELMEWPRKKARLIAGLDKLMHIASLDKPTGETEDSGTLADLVPSDECVEDMVIDRLFADYRSAVLWAEVEKLPKEQKDVIKWRYLFRQTLKHIAENTGKSLSRIQQLEYSALRELKRRAAIIRLARLDGLEERIGKGRRRYYDPLGALLDREDVEGYLKAIKEGRIRGMV